MRLKTSFFNKALFLSDIKRYWWICAAQTLLLILTCAVPVYSMCLNAYLHGYFDISSWIHTALFVTIPFGFGTAIILFSFMHFNASVSCIHSLPVKRSSVFVTKLASGALFCIVPIVITALVLLGMSAGETCRDYIETGDVIKWAYVAFIYGTIAFSLTTVVNMMTGNPIGTVIFTIGFAVIVPIFIAIFTSIFDAEVHGFNSRYADSVLEYIYIAPNRISKAKYAIIYPIMSAVFLAGAYALYRVRKSERHGEVIAFPKLAPVFIAVIAILASGIGHSYCTGILEIKSLFTMLPFGILGTAIAYMIWKKSLVFKGCIRPVGIYLAIALLFIAAIKFDLTGFERAVPDPDDVEGVSVSTNFDRDEPLFTKKEHIEAVTRLHSHLTAQKNRPIMRGAYNEIIYKLKNGRTMRRNYIVDYKADENFLKPVYETYEFKKEQFELLAHEEGDFTAAEICDRRFANGNYMTLYPDSDMFKKIVAAVRKDLENTSYDDLTHSRYASITVALSWTQSEKGTDEKYQRSEAFCVTESAVNTKKILEELGVYESLPTADDIKHINVTVRDNKNGEEISNRKIDDTKVIADIYAMYDEMVSEEQTYSDYENSFNVYIEYVLKSDYNFGLSRTYDKTIIPSIFR